MKEEMPAQPKRLNFRILNLVINSQPPVQASKNFHDKDILKFYSPPEEPPRGNVSHVIKDSLGKPREYQVTGYVYQVSRKEGMKNAIIHGVDFIA